MRAPNQVEIIGPGGAIEFHDLDETKAIFNIGRHPANDIVIDSPRVRPFHALLDCRQKPYQIVALGDDGETRIAGRRLSPKASAPLGESATVEIGNHTLILLEAAPIAAGTGGGVAPGATAVRKTDPAEAPVAPAARPPRDLVVTLSTDSWTADVEQTVHAYLTIANGSGAPATFVVELHGLDQSWVRLSPSLITLNRGSRATVGIAITAPRLPASRAGVHHLTILVTSPTYPGWRREQPATLVLNPYHDFAVGEISPGRQTLSRSKSAAMVTLPVVNRGNADARFRLEATDDAGLCHFEFHLPGEAASLAHQAELRLSPGETIALPVRVIPPARPFAGLGKRRHHFRLTATMVAGQQPSRSVLGELACGPVLGPGPIALALLAVLALVGYLLQPGAGRLLPAPPEQVASDPAPRPAGLLEISRTPGGPFALPPSREVPPPSEPPPGPGPGSVMTYEQIFKEVASQFGLDWRLLAAVAYQESRYDPLAVGKYGEYGLMQIMPSTWELMAPQVGVSNPWDPYSNVLVAAAFLAFLRDSFSGAGYPDQYWVLVGYNWGPANVRRLWSNGQGWDHVPGVPRRYAEEVWTAATGALPAWIEPHLARTVPTSGDPRLGMSGPAE